MRIRFNKIDKFSYSMAYCSFAMYYILALLIFDWGYLKKYFFTFYGLFDNWIYYTGMAMTVFWLSDYLRKKKFHTNANHKNLIAYSMLIFIYTLFIVFLNDFTQIYQWTNSTETFWKSMYIRTISSSLISIVYIIRNYGQIIQENTELNLELKESLQKESEKATKAQMNMLKLQLDPHFMFNSLNTLVGLIDESPQKAEEFILELSHIYKYIVANLDRDTISLKAGMKFINNYCKLIEIRYPQEFLLDIEESIAKNSEEKILPLSLQLLVENAIKHNQHSTKTPLLIQIKREGNFICVTNSINPYPGREKEHILSMGIGMKNLNDRYKLICDRIPITLQSKSKYTVKIPII